MKEAIKNQQQWVTSVVTVSIVSRLLEGHNVILCKEVAHEVGI